MPAGEPPLRVGLAGLGIHGSRYANHLLRGDVPGAVLSAVSRRDERAGREFARRHGVRFVAEPRELATIPDLDAVVAVLPPDLHPAVARACLETGRPVLVEKPLAADARSAALVAEAAGAARAPLMVAQTLRFDAVVEAVRREMASLGPIRLVALNQRFEPTSRAWIDEPGRGGALLNTGIHGLDLLRLLTGAEPESVVASTRAFVTRETEDEFAGLVRLEPGNILATIDNARTTDGRSGRIEVVGRHGQVCGDHVHRTLVRIEGRRASDLGPIPDRPTVPRVVGAFVDCVRRGVEPPVTASDGRAAVEMVEACALSARLGRWVRLDEVRGGLGAP